MQRKLFVKRFFKYFLLLIIPTLLAFFISFFITNSQVDKGMDAQAENTLSNVNTNLNLVLSGVMYQNNLLTNNTYMLISLKSLLRGQEKLSYRDMVYLRNIRAMMDSIVQSYPYIQSVYLYLEGYERFYSSSDKITYMENTEDKGWLDGYHRMDPETERYMNARAVDSGQEENVLTIYQRMLLHDGVIVMNINVDKYCELLESILSNDYETVLYMGRDGAILFEWNLQDEAVRQISLNDVLENDNDWIKIGKKRYLLHKAYNEQYGIYTVSLVSMQARMAGILPVLRLFFMMIIINTVAMLLLAYFTTRSRFKQLYYMIQVFDEAEKAVYPKEPRHDVKDEYDVILNNIIYLFLKNVAIDRDLKERRYAQEVAELKALQLQINPHFLFNTLQTVQFEIQGAAPNLKRASEALDNLSDILKYSLADSRETISLREEIKYLKKYVEIQKMRFGDKFIIYYDIEEKLKNFQVLRMMLQPLVENSISHGIRYISGRGYIKVKVFCRNGRVFFSVIDTGAGLSGEECRSLNCSVRNLENQHIGLANVNNRLVLQYDESAGLHIYSKKGMGTAVTFSLPYESVKIE